MAHVIPILWSEMSSVHVRKHNSTEENKAPAMSLETWGRMSGSNTDRRIAFEKTYKFSAYKETFKKLYWVFPHSKRRSRRLAGILFPLYADRANIVPLLYCRIYTQYITRWQSSIFEKIDQLLLCWSAVQQKWQYHFVFKMLHCVKATEHFSAF